MAVNPTNTELHFLVPQPRVALDTVRDPVHVQVHSVIVTYSELHILGELALSSSTGPSVKASRRACMACVRIITTIEWTHVDQRRVTATSPQSSEKPSSPKEQQREITIDVSPLNEKAPCPIDVTESGITMDVRPSQPIKAISPIDVTELGITTDVSPLHPSKAEVPIEVTESGITIDVSPLHRWKAA
eukprot:m.285665 g.285665  ORF g.285665 m.285665 type:complete len:188 (-) comp27038_c0_seq11:11-574(-)